MRKNKYLYIFSSILLCLFSFFVLSNVYAQGKEFTVDSILINNEEINIEDGCNLKLKYNDVIRIAGRNTPNEKVVLLFADQEYATQTNNDGNWMILISIPYIDDGEYQVKNKNTNICNITVGEANNEDDNTDNIQIPNYLILILLPCLIVTSLSFILFKKNKKKND